MMSIAEEIDGRRRRGQDNRARIVAAMLEMTREGVVTPSAEQVAARAQVGLRTVFRHFDDMDSLYREMSVVIEAELRAIVERPFAATDWQGRLAELIARRGEAFENITPFKRASDAVRHRSRFLAQDHERFARTLRDLLKGVLPADIAADPVTLETIDLLASFEAWTRLRHDQKLSPEETRRILQSAVSRLAAAP